MSALFTMGDTGASPIDLTNPPTRAEIAKLMAEAPPASAFKGEIAFIVANADLLRDDYAEVLADISAETKHGQRQKLICYGIGGVLGLALGVLIGKAVL